MGKKPTSSKTWTVLSELRDSLPPGPAVPPPSPPVAAVPSPPARAVVRLERKGRAGKEATVVEKLALSPDELDRWCKELKAGLGCGGAVDGEAIVLQGDLRRRVEALLTARGVKKVTVSG